MFKKAVEAKAQQRLSGADRKKLKRTIRDRFPRASDADIDALLPPKAEITVSKFQNRVHVYGVEGGVPLFFNVDGRGSEIYPTVFALWKLPEMLPYFMLKGGEVSRFVIGGADLMFPGISVAAEGLPSFSAGEPWAVKVPGNPAPIAVGSTTMSSAEALKAGLRGKALRIMHYYHLCRESVEGHYVPNSGFLEDVVLEDPSFLASNQPSDSSEGATCESDVQQSCVNNENTEGSIDVNGAISDACAASMQNDSENAAKEIMMDASDLKSTANVDAAKLDIELSSLSIEDVDSHLDRCLLQALHTTVKDKDLPMPGSTSNHVLPCRPSGITLDIKKSSHKKLSKWLQAKTSTGLITVKEDKYKKEAMLISVNRGHPEYLQFKPEKQPVEKVVQAGDSAASESRSQKALEVVEVYKSSVHVNPIFASVGADTGKLYSASEATDIVFKYIEKENLVKQTNKATVVLDATLCDALFKGAIKKGSTYPTEIHKKDLGATFINRMQAHHMVTRGGESVVRKGVLKTVQIMTERRQGNKKVTKVSGLETFLIDPEALASELQKKFACSTTVAELP
ncbi:hypothetical protein Gohar_007880, partial [Gossypium harknessii]|nr:hypothetical protein [Gossypium harknessii]